ncbi:MAG: hypothetical protein RI928_1852 [Pseudomonadota bacterium]|jgi:hypothetical protein
MISGMGNAASAAATSFSESKETQSAAGTGSLKINYGDASKAERLVGSLTKIQQLQTQAQVFVTSRYPDYVGID